MKGEESQGDGSLSLTPEPLLPFRVLGRTWDINGATMAPMRHREPLVPMPRARIVVG